MLAKRDTDVFNRKPPTFSRTIRTLVAITTALAVIVVTTPAALYDLVRIGRERLIELSAVSSRLAADGKAALLVDDHGAPRPFAALDGRSSIGCAYLYDAKGRVVANFVGDTDTSCTPPPTPYANGHHLEGWSIAFSRVLTDGNQYVGALYLSASTKELRARLLTYVGLQMMLALLVGWVALLLASHRVEQLSKPVVSLIATARRALDEKDYSLRLEREGSGEILSFIDSFNELLAELQRRTHELVESEHRSQALLESIADGIITTNSRHNIEIFNLAAEEMFGYTADEVVGQHIHRLIPALDQEARDVNTARYVGTGDAMIISAGVELQGVRKDGAEFPIELAVSEAYLADRRMFTTTIRDISERKYAEEEKAQYEFRARQSQKMEALGVLAGGIAHDFNNILGVIVGNAELAMNKVPAENRAYVNLERVLQAGHRAKELVKQMLTFSRQTETERSPIRLDRVVTEVLKLLEASIPAMIEIRCHVDPHAGHVLANETQIHQILMNLCTNAHHAMSEKGGVLEVTLAAQEFGMKLVGVHSEVPPGHYVKLSVSDTGHGIDEETLQRIFDPFFSTKGPEGGTGMGLAVVHGIVVDYGGAITVTSRPDRGTRFDIYLPRVEGAALTAAPVKAAAPIEAPSRSARVLVVDDEPALVETAREMLANLGYNVTAMVSSMAALTAFRSEPQRYDLVITDQAMPELQGTDFARALLKIRPELPIILVTGYSRQLTPEMAREAGVRGYIPKPYTAGELQEAIGHLFAEEPTEETTAEV